MWFICFLSFLINLFISNWLFDFICIVFNIDWLKYSLFLIVCFDIVFMYKVVLFFKFVLELCLEMVDDVFLVCIGIFNILLDSFCRVDL